MRAASGLPDAQPADYVLTAKEAPNLATIDEGFFFSSRRRHTSYIGDWSSDVCSSDLVSLLL